MRKLLSWLMVVLIAASLLLAGCANAPDTTGGGQPKTAGKIRVGVSLDTLKEERWTRDKLHLEEHAKELGVELIVTVANSDDARQANDVDNLLTQKVIKLPTALCT